MQTIEFQTGTGAFKKEVKSVADSTNNSDPHCGWDRLYRTTERSTTLVGLAEVVCEPEAVKPVVKPPVQEASYSRLEMRE